MLKTMPSSKVSRGLCVLLWCFPGQETVRGGFLLKPADTLILKQPREANLHLDHLRYFHRKSAQKHLSFVFQLPRPFPVSPLWGLNEVFIWTSDRWYQPRRPCCLSAVLCYGFLLCHQAVLYVSTVKDWAQWSAGGGMGGIKKEQWHKLMVEQRDLDVEGKGLKQRWCERDSDGSVGDQEVEAPPAPSRLLSIHPSGRKCVRINKKRGSLERGAERALAQPRPPFGFIKQLLVLFWVWIENNELKCFCCNRLSRRW